MDGVSQVSRCLVHSADGESHGETVCWSMRMFILRRPSGGAQSEGIKADGAVDVCGAESGRLCWPVECCVAARFVGHPITDSDSPVKVATYNAGPVLVDAADIVPLWPGRTQR